MKTRLLVLILAFLTLLGVSIVLFLKFYSERIVSYQNRLNRLFPVYTEEGKILDLKYDSFYFAGHDHNSLFLGNYVGPLTITRIDTSLTFKSILNIELKEPEFRFRSPQIRIFKGTVYFIDGTLPVLFSGKLGNVLVQDTLFRSTGFFKYQIAEGDRVIYNYIDEGSKLRNIGTSLLDGTSKNSSNPALLKTDTDGIFDTDGHLMYDVATKHLIYLYRYKNTFIKANLDLELLGSGRTIDTIAEAQVVSKQVPDRDIIKMSKRPLTVNNYSFCDNGYLFVHSNIPGVNEPLEMWDKASIIDIYDLFDNSYKASFYVYHIKGKKLKSFYVNGCNFYAMIGNHIVKYDIGRLIKVKSTIGR